MHVLTKSRLLLTLLGVLIIISGFGPLLRSDGFTAAQVVGLLFLAIALLRTDFKFRQQNLILILFGFTYCLCITFNGQRLDLQSLSFNLIYVMYSLFALAVSSLHFKPSGVSLISYCMVFAGVLAAGSAIFEDITGFNYFSGKGILDLYGVNRAVGLHGNPSATAGFIIIGIVSAFYLLLESGRLFITRLLLALILAGFFYGLQATASRGGVLALFLSLSPFLFHKNVEKHRYVVIGISLVLMILSFSLLTRGRELEFSDDPAAAKRMELYIQALYYFLDNPITGYSGVVSNDFITAHNNFLQIMAFGGLASLLPYLLIHLMIFINIYKYRNNEQTLYWAGIFISFTIMGLSHLIYNNIIYWIAIGACLQIPYTAYRRSLFIQR